MVQPLLKTASQKDLVFFTAERGTETSLLHEQPVLHSDATSYAHKTFRDCVANSIPSDYCKLGPNCAVDAARALWCLCLCAMLENLSVPALRTLRAAGSSP